MKQLDIIQLGDGSVGIITEGRKSFSIRWWSGVHYKSAWWSEEELTSLGGVVIANLPNTIATNFCHPFGDGKDSANKLYPVKED